MPYSYRKAVYDGDEEFAALTDVGYLMPCNMRAIARWMNVFDWARWAKVMIEAEHNLKAWERKTLPENLAAKRVRILSQAS